MKKKLIIASSLITILLALFPVSLYAEEVVQDPAPAYTTTEGTLLDSYFYQNYDLLPYIESDGNQYIDTGIYSTNNLRVECNFSDISNNQGYIYSGYTAENNKDLSLYYQVSNQTVNDSISFYFYNTRNIFTQIDINSPYSIFYTVADKNEFDINGYDHTFTDTDFTSTYTIKIFSASQPQNYKSSCRLYKFSIFDYSADSGNGAYVRYFYPAKAKTSGTIGLYDSVSKTFFPSLGNDPFSNPTDDKVLHFQIGDFVTAGLTWIGDILDFAIDTPIILFFLAVGLAGAMYRWARRIVHF